MSTVVLSGDTSGAITISAPAVAGTNTLTLPAVTDTLTGIAATQTLTNKTLTSPTLTTPALGTPASGILTSCTGVNYDGYKNRIINGAMVIDQRNAGASVTPTDAQYCVDRWRAVASAASKFTVQQSTTAPDGFTNSLLLTSSSAYTPSTSEAFGILQLIEGFNCSDLMFGTATAKTITVSFWVRSSLTGTFGGFLTNASFNRAYPFTYTINSANTFEQKTVTIAGDTTGTWATNSSGCIGVGFSIGAGATLSATAGAWGAGTKLGATGQTQLISTSGATFYITGVQLEKGSTATSFDYRPYGTELLLCQRYYETTAYPDVTFTAGATRSGLVFGGGGANSSGFSFLVPKRTNSPTVTLYSRNNTSGAASLLATGADITGSTANGICGTGFRCTQLGSSQSSVVGIETGWTVSAEL